MRPRKVNRNHAIAAEIEWLVISDGTVLLLEALP